MGYRGGELGAGVEGAGSGEREGAGSFNKSSKGVRHVLNPNAKLGKRLFCDIFDDFT